MESVFRYHMVFRPPLDLLPTYDDFHHYVQKYRSMTNYSLGAEKGKSIGKEEYNHFDLVLELSNEQRPDSIKRAFCNYFSIPDLKRKNIKVYLLEDEKYLYYIGYSLKENILLDHNYTADVIAEAGKVYDSIGPVFEEKFGKDRWTVDDIAKEFRKHLQEMFEDRRGKNYLVTEGDAALYYKIWVRAHRDRIPFSVYAKINHHMITEYVADVEN